MLTYSLEDRGTDSLYEYIYKCIKNDILKGHIKPDEKLPSKRAFARQHDISVITVENAYGQLQAEGYIYSKAKSGFYVSKIEKDMYISAKKDIKKAYKQADCEVMPAYYASFTAGSAGNENFPFSIWTRLLRETLSEDSGVTMRKSPAWGVPELRNEIADYLRQFRGMDIDPNRIVIGAGTEYLYGLIIQLLGRDKCYAMEEPGYLKISHIYEANDVKEVHIPLDEKGIDMEKLKHSDADVVHISPSHHFPTGIITPVSRRYELMSWVASGADRYIIEDDYDSEFRMQGRPIPTLWSMDMQDRTIYINTFSKSLSSTIRISYMVLPERLMSKFKQELGFYSCTVSNFDQYTLAKFIGRGYFEKHINRMRNHYKSIRDTMLSAIRDRRDYDRVTISEEDAGLHFLMEVETAYTDSQLIRSAADHGIEVSALSQYYNDSRLAKEHTLLINYAGISADKIYEAVDRLFDSFD